MVVIGDYFLTKGKNMGGTTKEVLTDNTKPVSWKGHEQWKNEKVDPWSRDIQSKAGEQTGAAYKTVKQIPDQLAKTGREIGEFLNPTSPGESSDGSSEANYTARNSNKSNKTGSKGVSGGNLGTDKKTVAKGKGKLYAKKTA
tara:strand:- start:452 stop:877 length:426 start_codon:yes stop_codon:yes gene_type:complete